MKSTTALEVRDLAVAYDGQVAVRDVSLRLDSGDVLAVLGPSGCGKSTLLRAVAGLEPLAAGSVRWAGADLAKVPTHRRGFALMFQDGQLFGHLSVARNVGYALRLRRTPRVRVAARVAELLDLVGLGGYGDRMPATLSGGERQRVALARALAVEPRLLLLDEPLSALDASLRESLAEDLRDILRAAGTTALMVTHDHDEAFTVADRIAVMFDGTVEQEGPIAQVWAAPATPRTAVFLGYATVLQPPAADVVCAAAGLPLASGTGGALALRRSALKVDGTPADGGVGTGLANTGLAGEVVAVTSTPDQLRLRVQVAGVGELDAVAPLDARVVTGDVVALRVVPTRVARVPQRT